ncbi:lipoprotein [Leptospira ryugenii]|uniref:Lipoprotein n=2 Tax=Leptospira ryugenii TaxID=1917863 RepID=A0A2P2E251_9LEPT|nr:lipoprotein [Leptospira ryugenii]
MKVRNEIHLYDAATNFYSTNYVVLGKGKGEDTAFFLLGMIPVTKAPSIDLAMSQVLEKFPEGRSLVNIQIIREDRPYFPLGLVTAVVVVADVIGEKKIEEDTIQTKEKKK